MAEIIMEFQGRPRRRLHKFLHNPFPILLRHSSVGNSRHKALVKVISVIHKRHIIIKPVINVIIPGAVFVPFVGRHREQRTVYQNQSLQVSLLCHRSIGYHYGRAHGPAAQYYVFKLQMFNQIPDIQRISLHRIAAAYFTGTPLSSWIKDNYPVFF